MKRVRPHARYHVAMRQLEIQFIRANLRETGGNITRASEMLGVPYNYLYRRMERLGLDPKSERALAIGQPVETVESKGQ